MASVQKDNIQKIITQKRQKIQWGVSVPVDSSNNPQTQIKQVSQPYTIKIQKNESQKLDKNRLGNRKVNHNGIDFMDLPVKQSQIISNYNKNTNNRTQIQYHETYEVRHEGQDNRETMNRLNQLKNEFQILRDMMIDSTILDGNKNVDKLSHMSGSNIGYSVKGSRLKTGQIVREKQRLGKKSKVSSSSASLRDQNLYKKSKVSDKSYHNAQALDSSRQKDYIKQSKISKSKHSQHRSQNPRQNSHSRQPSRVSKRQQDIKYGGFLSNNILQKQSLQLQLRNSLQKTQILIQNEIKLKTKNHELQETLKQYMNRKQPNEAERYQRRISQLSLKLQQYEDELARERSSHKQLISKIGRLQAEAIANQAVMAMLKQQKNKQASNTMSMKLNLADLQIENKRLQMERDIDLRDKQYQINRLRKQLQFVSSSASYVVRSHQSNSNQHTYQKDRIRFLQLQLQQRDRKYKQVLREAEAKKQIKDEAQLMQLIQKMHKNKPKDGEGAVTKQLSKLKQQIIKIKNQHDLTQSQFGVQSKVISLEQALKKDNEEKQKYLIEIERFQKQYQEMKSKYRLTQQQKQDQIQQLTQNMNRLKADLEQASPYKQKCQQLKRQYHLAHERIDELQAIIRNYQQIQHQVSKLRQALKQKDIAHNLQIRDARRRVDHAEFQSFKSQQQNKFNLDINTRKLASEIQVLNTQLKAIEADRNYHRDQFMGLRNYNNQLIMRIKQLQIYQNQKVSYQTQAELQQKDRIRRQYQNQINGINQQFYAQQQKLVAQITQLTKTNQQMSAATQNNQLRTLCRRKISTQASILHLWEIKQVEYQNLNQLLSIIKPKSATPSNSVKQQLVQSRPVFEQNVRTIPSTGQVSSIPQSKIQPYSYNNMSNTPLRAEPIINTNQSSPDARILPMTIRKTQTFSSGDEMAL